MNRVDCEAVAGDCEANAPDRQGHAGKREGTATHRKMQSRLARNDGSEVHDGSSHQQARLSRCCNVCQCRRARSFFTLLQEPLERDLGPHCFAGMSKARACRFCAFLSITHVIVKPSKQKTSPHPCQIREQRCIALFNITGDNFKDAFVQTVRVEGWKASANKEINDLRNGRWRNWPPLIAHLVVGRQSKFDLAFSLLDRSIAGEFSSPYFRNETVMHS
jgi:hypothetical protein